MIAVWKPGSVKETVARTTFNKGLKHVSGEIIGWLNSDDIYLNQCLFGAAEYFFKHQDVDIVFSDYIYIDENGHYLRGGRSRGFTIALTYGPATVFMRTVRASFAGRNWTESASWMRRFTSV